jgi:ubiquitin carboxyl-terminal hydrolase 7
MVGSLPIVTKYRTQRLMMIVSDDTIYDHKFAPEDTLGLDHIDKSGKTRNGSGEKAIVIKG